MIKTGPNLGILHLCSVVYTNLVYYSKDYKIQSFLLRNDLQQNIVAKDYDDLFKMF